MGRRFTALLGIAILAAFGGWLSFSLPSWMFRVSFGERSQTAAEPSVSVSTLARSSAATLAVEASPPASEPPPAPSDSDADPASSNEIAASASVAESEPRPIAPGELLASVTAAPPPRFEVEDLKDEGDPSSVRTGEVIETSAELNALPVLDQKSLSLNELLAQAAAIPPAPAPAPASDSPVGDARADGAGSKPQSDPDPELQAGADLNSPATTGASATPVPVPVPDAQPAAVGDGATGSLADQIAAAKLNDSPLPPHKPEPESSETAAPESSEIQADKTERAEMVKSTSRFRPEDFERVDPALLLSGPLGLPAPAPLAGGEETAASALLTDSEAPKRDVSLRPTAAGQDLLPDPNADAPAKAESKPQAESGSEPALASSPTPNPNSASSTAPAPAPAPVPDPFAESEDAVPGASPLRPVAADVVPKFTDPFAESEGAVKTGAKPDPFAETEAQEGLFNGSATKTDKPKAKLVGLDPTARLMLNPKPTAVDDAGSPAPPPRPVNDAPPPKPADPPPIPAPALSPRPEPEPAILPAPEPEPEPDSEADSGSEAEARPAPQPEGAGKTQDKETAPASGPAPAELQPPDSVPLPNPEPDADADPKEAKPKPDAPGAGTGPGTGNGNLEEVPSPPADQTKGQPQPEKPEASPLPSSAPASAPNPAAPKPAPASSPMPSAESDAEPPAESKGKSGSEEPPQFVLPLDRLTLLAQDLGLNVAVQAPDKVNLGKPLTLKIIVRNTSSTDAQEVLVRGQLPEIVEYVDSRPEAHRVDGQIVTWRLGTVAAKSDRELLIGVIPRSTGSFEFAATIAALGGARARPTSVLEPRLDVKLKTSPERTIQKGRSVRLEIEVSNPGTGLARDVRVQVGLTSGLKYQQKSAAEREIVTFDQRFDLPAGESKTLLPHLNVEATAPGEQSIQVIAKSADVVESESANRSVTLNVVEPQLKVKLVGPERRYTDTVAVYDLIVENPGTAPAANVAVSAILTEGGVLVSKGDGQFDAQRRRLSWTLPVVEPGKPVLLKFEVRMSRAANYRVNAEARTEEGLQSSDSWTTEVVGIADLSAFTVEEKHRILDVGMQTDFEIRVKNDGTKEARNVNVTAKLSSQLKVLSTGGTKEQAKLHGPTNEVHFPTITRIEPNASVLLTIRVEASGRGAASCDVAVKHEDLGDVPIRKTAVVPVTEDRRKR